MLYRMVVLSNLTPFETRVRADNDNDACERALLNWLDENMEADSRGWTAVFGSNQKWMFQLTLDEFIERAGSGAGDAVLFVADRAKVVNAALGNLRNHKDMSRDN